jgi:general secretion pathway protein B
MSYILDALKKLEHEKEKKKRGAGMSCISGELFRDEYRPAAAGGGRWKLLVALVLVASLATFGVTWLLLRGDGTLKKEKIAKAPAVAAPAVSPPVASSPAPSPPAGAVVPGSTPASAPTSASPSSPTSALAPAPVAAAVAAPPAEKPAPAPVRTAKRKATPLARKRPDPPQAQPAPAAPGQMELPPTPPPVDIKVSGIAWQDTRSASRAVVNGFLLQEGNVVSGAKITEILQDRVRFSLSGRTFDVPLVSSGAPAGK